MPIRKTQSPCYSGKCICLPTYNSSEPRDQGRDIWCGCLRGIRCLDDFGLWLEFRRTTDDAATDNVAAPAEVARPPPVGRAGLAILDCLVTVVLGSSRQEDHGHSCRCGRGDMAVLEARARCLRECPIRIGVCNIAVRRGHGWGISRAQHRDAVWTHRAFFDFLPRLDRAPPSVFPKSTPIFCSRALLTVLPSPKSRGSSITRSSGFAQFAIRCRAVYGQFATSRAKCSCSISFLFNNGSRRGAQPMRTLPPPRAPCVSRQSTRGHAGILMIVDDVPRRRPILSQP